MENARDSIILAADLPDYASIESRSRERAAELASRFHQILSECVYASGGTVNDTISSLVIAEIPNATDAVHAIENLRKRVETELASDTANPRAVLSSGEVYEKDFSLAGRAVQNALAILDSLVKNQMVVSSDIITQSGHVPEGEPVLKLGETGYFALPLSGPASAGREPVQPGATVPAASTETTSGSEGSEPSVPRRKELLIALAVLLTIVIAATAFWLTRDRSSPTVAEGPDQRAALPADGSIELTVAEVSVAADVETEEVSGTAVDLITALLRAGENVKLSAHAKNRIGADIRMISPEPAPQQLDDGGAPVTSGAQPLPSVGTPRAAAEPRVVPWLERSGERFEGPVSDYGDVWSIVVPTVQWAGAELGFPSDPLIPSSERLRETFRTVVTASSGASSQALSSLHRALSEEPGFVPGWLALARAETEDPKLRPAITDALRNVSRLLPERTDLARDLGRRELSDGTLDGALEGYARVRAEEPQDDEALRVFALAALASHQPEVFRGFATASRDPRIHPADVEVSEGKINEAVKQYYETETEVPDNPYLSFKIGRIAVLRRSAQIAKIEMDKLESSGVEPQRSFLQAYMAAEEGDRSSALAALEEGLEHAEWDDSASFHTAELYAILRDAGKALAAIERSVERREPMMHAISTNPLFGYLTNEPRFREAVRTLVERQRDIAVSLREHS